MCRQIHKYGYTHNFTYNYLLFILCTEFHFTPPADQILLKLPPHHSRWKWPAWEERKHKTVQSSRFRDVTEFKTKMQLSVCLALAATLLKVQEEILFASHE